MRGGAHGDLGLGVDEVARVVEALGDPHRIVEAVGRSAHGLGVAHVEPRLRHVDHLEAEGPEPDLAGREAPAGIAVELVQLHLEALGNEAGPRAPFSVGCPPVDEEAGAVRVSSMTTSSRVSDPGRRRCRRAARRSARESVSWAGSPETQEVDVLLAGAVPARWKPEVPLVPCARPAGRRSWAFFSDRELREDGGALGRWRRAPSITWGLAGLDPVDQIAGDRDPYERSGVVSSTGRTPTPRPSAAPGPLGSATSRPTRGRR